MLGIAGWNLFQGRRNPEPVDRRTSTLRGLGFVLALASSCGLATLHFSGGSFPNTAGGLLGTLAGDGLAQRHELPRRHAAAARRLARLGVALHRHLLARRDGPDRSRRAARDFVAAGPAVGRARREGRTRGEAGATGSRARRTEEGRGPQAAADRGAGAEGREERARREGKAGPDVREAGRHVAAGAVAARRRAGRGTAAIRPRRSRRCRASWN